MLTEAHAHLLSRGGIQDCNATVLGAGADGAVQHHREVSEDLRGDLEATGTISGGSWDRCQIPWTLLVKLGPGKRPQEVATGITASG